MTIKILSVQDGENLEHIITLAREYVSWMIAEIEKQYPQLDIEAFKAEHSYDDIHKKFPGEHIPPDGCLLLAIKDDTPVGCIALGKLSENIAEVRTLFVREAGRGSGVGKQLVEAALKQAKKSGYDRVRLDTLAFMDAAFKLYQSFGFYEIEAYLEMPDNLKTYIRFLELKFE